MPVHHAAAVFFAGALLANFVPHFVAGVSGRTFPSPFAKPRFRGHSSPAVNVFWGLSNLAAAYVLLVVVADFDARRAEHVAVVAAGFALVSVALARKLGRLHTESP